MVSRGKGFGRQRGQRRERKRVLVVTEGEKTEVQYLQGLAQYLRATGASVKSLRSKGIGKDPLRVVRAALDLAASDEDGYDQVWVVVDVDEHATLTEALRLARESSVPVVVSNPCFEIWLLWHYEDCTAHRTSAQLVARLTKHGHAGKDVPSGFPFSDVDRAVARANGSPIRHTTAGENPSTAMPHLVSALQQGA